MSLSEKIVGFLNGKSGTRRNRPTKPRRRKRRSKKEVKNRGSLMFTRGHFLHPIFRYFQWMSECKPRWRKKVGVREYHFRYFFKWTRQVLTEMIEARKEVHRIDLEDEVLLIAEYCSRIFQKYEDENTLAKHQTRRPYRKYVGIQDVEVILKRLKRRSLSTRAFLIRSCGWRTSEQLYSFSIDIWTRAKLKVVKRRIITEQTHWWMVFAWYSPNWLSCCLTNRRKSNSKP